MKLLDLLNCPMCDRIIAKIVQRGNNVKAIIAGINLLLAAGFGALAILKVAKGDGLAVDKVVKVRDELTKILDKLDKLAKETTPEWDDSLSGILSAAVEAIAGTLIEQLEG